MGKIVTSSYRRVSDHFEPDLVEDPHEQRKRRGHLEQIDYTVFAANQAVMAKTIHSHRTKQPPKIAPDEAYLSRKFCVGP